MKKLKTVNGYLIKRFTRGEIDQELRDKGDWGLNYYVPGRVIKSFYITINREKYRFEKLEKLEKFCRENNKEDMKKLSEEQIRELMWDYQYKY